MPNFILEQIKIKESFEKIKGSNERVPLFVSLNDLQNRSLYEHLKLYGKVYHWSLAEFIQYEIIDFNEVDAHGNNLMCRLVDDHDLENFKQLLLAGQKPSEQIYLNSEDSAIGNLLRYRPGRKNPSVYELSTKRVPDTRVLLNVFYDFHDTTDEESSDADLSDMEELTQEQAILYKEKQARTVAAYNATKKDGESLSFVAARGVHFMQKYFPKPLRQAIRESKRESHTTYSFSTLFDSGYTADNEPDENDTRIVNTHHRNIKFIGKLQATADQKEKKTGTRNPPAERNKRVFENLFWREIQVYINSYDTLFHLNGIQINFSFESKNNPHLSLSWKTEVSGMYSSGVRFGWKQGGRRDPHYRRYDNVPKHPNMGYIDIFDFPLEYVRANGVDRLFAYNNRKIDLSNTHLAEAEIIFHSMIPQKYHVRRYMIVLPSFNKVTSTAQVEERYFGLTKKGGAYTKARDGLFSAIDKKSKGEQYQEWITKRSEHAVEAQAKLIDKSMEMRLFNSGKVRAYDHGEMVSTFLPTPHRK